MALRYTCPGRPGPGWDTVHLDGCCAQFALASPERRAKTGVGVPERAPREPLPAAPSSHILSVNQLIKVVEQLIRRAAEFPDEEPPGATVWAEYGPDHTEADIQALYDLGRPYNLVLGYRRVPEQTERITAS